MSRRAGGLAGWVAQAAGAAVSQRRPDRFWPWMTGSLALAGAVSLPSVRTADLRCGRRWAAAGVGAGVGLHLLVRLAAPRAAGFEALGPGLARLRAGARSVPAPVAAGLTVPAALGEELYWRALGPSWSRAGGAALSISLYLLAQLPSANPLLPLGAVPVGLVGGWLRARSGSLAPSLLAHLTFSELTLVWPGIPRVPAAPGSPEETEP